MKYNFKIHKSTDGFWAECIELQGCVTQADSRSELEVNMQEALNLYLSENSDSRIIFRVPQEKITGKNIVQVKVNPSVAVAMNIRQARLRMNKTQREMATLLGVKHLSNYQRLEDPKRANPELKTIVALMELIPDLKLDKIIASYRYS